MSGVVIKLNEDEEDDDEEADVAGLLSRHRRQDDKDDEDDDDGNHDRRRSRSRKRKLRTNVKLPFQGVRTSSWAQLLIHTLALCCVFFAIGLTKSLVDVPDVIVEPSKKEIASSVGYVIGFLLGGVLLSRLSQSFLVLLTMSVLSSMLFLVPWLTSNWANVTVYGIIGGTLAVLMIEGNVLCFDFWGNRSGPYIHALHFCLSLGLLTGPLLVEPISQTRLPEIVQKALPQGSAKVQATLSPLDDFATVLSTNKWIVKREAGTPDPILANLFPTMVLESSSLMSSVKTPKPKPIFTDARKLDNSRDWENVKIPKPSKEEMIATRTSSRPLTTISTEIDPVLDILKGVSSTNSTTQIKETDPMTLEINREVKGLEQDIQENGRILEWLQSSSTLAMESTEDTILKMLMNQTPSPDDEVTEPSTITTTTLPTTVTGTTSDNIIGILKSNNLSLVRRKRSGQEKKRITLKNHHLAHSPFLSGSMTHDDTWSWHKNKSLGTHKLSKRGIPRTGYGDLEEPPIYNRPRYSRPHQRVPQQSQNGIWPVPRVRPGSVPQYQPPFADYPDSNSMDYANLDTKSETLPPLPEKLEKAIETVQEYLNHPDSVEDVPGIVASNKSKLSPTTSSTTTVESTTTMTTETTTTATTPSTMITSSLTTRAEIVLTTEGKKPNHRKKPLSSFDNDTEVDVTLGTVFNSYGVDRENIGFIFDSSYCFLVTLLLMMCSCLRPREPRTRLPMAESQSSSGGDRIFKATVVVLMFFFNLLHWQFFISVRRILPRFQFLFQSSMRVERVFEGVFTGSRLIAVFTSGLLTPSISIVFSLFLVCGGSAILAFAETSTPEALWVAVILQAVGTSTLLPTSLQWCQCHLLMYPHVVAGICWGLSLGELMVPPLLLFFRDRDLTWLNLPLLCTTFMCVGLFLCLFFIARKHKVGLDRPQTSGYELASQNDLNEDLLDDDEDFEVSEATLQFNSDSRDVNA